MNKRRTPFHLWRPLPGAGIGFFCVTTFGFIWGALWSTGPIQRHGKLWVFTGLPSWAFGRGGSCVGAVYLTGQNVNERVLRHEEIHRQQWRVLGLALPILYALYGRNPFTNRFEIEAGLTDGGYRTSSDNAPPAN